MYALPAKSVMFRSAGRHLPALATIRIPESVLSKKSAKLSKSVSGSRSPWRTESSYEPTVLLPA